MVSTDYGGQGHFAPPRRKAAGLVFSRKFKSLVDQYKERKEGEVLRSEVLEDFTEEITGLDHARIKILRKIAFHLAKFV